MTAKNIEDAHEQKSTLSKMRTFQKKIELTKLFEFDTPYSDSLMISFNLEYLKDKVEDIESRRRNDQLT